MIRPTWDEYFMLQARLVSTRSTCLAFPVGAVIVKDNQILASGYNGSPSGTSHCIEQGYCYPGLFNCADSSDMPSRAVHAEANAIAQAAKHGVSTQGAIIYVTLEPCISCLKLIISAGIHQVFYGKSFKECPVKSSFIKAGLVTLTKVEISQELLDSVFKRLTSD
jgi:dCMP deaminase